MRAWKSAQRASWKPWFRGTETYPFFFVIIFEVIEDKIGEVMCSTNMTWGEKKCHRVSEEHWKERLTEDGREIEAKMELTDNSSHDWADKLLVRDQRISCHPIHFEVEIKDGGSCKGEVSGT